MTDIWFIGDHHFSQHSILEYEGGRKEFKSIEEMDKTLIERHNSVVSKTDKVYFLGDIGNNKKTLSEILPSMNGKKRLILGNHDTYKMSFYMKYFDKILTSWRGIRGDIIFSHHPLLLSDENGIKLNVHGHVHRKTVKNPDGTDNKRYLNLSAENVNYTPVNFESIVEHLIRVNTN